MSDLKEMAGRLLVVGFSGQEAPPPLLERIRAGQVGGVVLFARNISEPRQVCLLIRELQQAAPAHRPLLVGVDQEGGRVQRLRNPLPLWPPMARLGELNDPQLAHDLGQAMAQDLALLGFNLNFAPVLDVVRSSQNSVIGDRSFGPDPQRVAALGLSLARGLQAGGVLPCGKHFPGHGGPVADSHETLPVDRRPADELLQQDLSPFKAAIHAGLPLLMSAHLLYPALDPRHPGTISPVICTDLLRGRLGYSGALFSDDLEMAAITDSLTPGEAAVAALRAGCDLLLFCASEESQREALDALVRAARADAGDRARLKQAVRRHSRLLQALPPPPGLSPSAAIAKLLARSHHKLLERLSA